MPEPVEADESDYEAFVSLRQRRVPEGRFIGDGIRVVRRILESDVAMERMLMTREWREKLAALIEQRSEPALRVRVAPKERLSEVVGFDLHQGVMAMARIPEPAPVDAVRRGKRSPLFVALDGLSNAENVGAVVRSCAAFGADGIFVGPHTTSPWMRRAVRASLGGVLRMPVWEVPDLAATLRDLAGAFPQGLPSVVSYAAHIHGERIDIAAADVSGPVCLVLGGEAKGVSDPVIAACRATVYIPMSGDWDCLNVTAATAVLLYAAARGRGTGASKRSLDWQKKEGWNSEDQDDEEIHDKERGREA